MTGRWPLKPRRYQDDGWWIVTVDLPGSPPVMIGVFFDRNQAEAAARTFSELARDTVAEAHPLRHPSVFWSPEELDKLKRSDRPT